VPPRRLAFRTYIAPQSSSSSAGSERSWRSFLINTAVNTAQWFADQPSDGARCALLLALLELTRRGFVLINQAHQAAPVRIKALCEVPEDVQVEEPAFALTA
jgi:hypothetical protein